MVGTAGLEGVDMIEVVVEEIVDDELGPKMSDIYT